MNIEMVWRQQPFSGKVQRQVLPPLPDGRLPTVAEAVAMIPASALPLGFAERGEVRMNGDIVKRGCWHLVRARRSSRVPVVITLHAPPGVGGGGGSGGKKNPLAIVAAVILTIAAFATGQGYLAFGNPWSLFAAGNIGAQLTSSALALSAALAYQALSPPPARASVKAQEQNEKGQSSLEGNVIEPGATLPHVCGTRKLFPPLICEPLNEIEGDDELVEAVYALAGAHDLSDIKVGDTPITDIADLQFEVRNGFESDTPIQLVQRQSRTSTAQIILSGPKVNKDDQNELEDQARPDQNVPQWHLLVSRVDPDEVRIGLAWPEGLFNEASVSSKTQLAVRLRMRQKGDSTWLNLPEVHFVNRRGQPFQKDIRLKWASAPATRAEPETDEAPTVAFRNNAFWTAHSIFGSSGDAFYDASNEATTGVQNVDLYEDRAEIFLNGVDFPIGTWEIQIMRSTVFTTGSFVASTYLYSGNSRDFFTYLNSGGTFEIVESLSNRHHKTVVSRVTSIWNEHPVQESGYTLIAVRARNRRVDALSCVASGYVLDWDGAGWNDLVTTSNPAPHFRAALVGKLNEDRLPLDLLDEDNIVAWRQHVIDQGYKADLVCENMTVGEVCSLLASAGWARPRQSELWGVVVDKDRSAEAPVQIFSPRTLEGFGWEKNFDKRPEGFRVEFRNKDLDYDRDEVIVGAPGVAPDQVGRLETISYESIVETALAEERAEFDQQVAQVRMTFYTGEVWTDGLVATRGDIVGVQHDFIDRYAGAARIREVIRNGTDIVALKLDQKVPMANLTYWREPPTYWDASGGTYWREGKTGLAIKKSDNSFVTREVSSADDEDDAFDLSTPISDPSELIREDAHVVSGRLGQEYRRMLLLDVKPKRDLRATVTMVDEAPQLFA